jgi:hypothetical protein
VNLDQDLRAGALLCLLIALGATHLAGQATSVIQGHVVDAQGLAIAGAEIIVGSPALIGRINITSDAAGSYRVPGLRPGTYHLRVTTSRFAAKLIEGLIVTVNRVMTFDIALDLGMVRETVTVAANAPQLDTAISSSGATILPQQVEQMPINGRNYLDLMQLVPGVTINRRVDSGTDTAAPILGERGGNAAFLIDGMPNSNLMDGGPAAPFSQDSILEFQVLTAGYKAEFGHGSGGIVNVVTKSGTSEWHGLVSAFHRNDALDSSDVPGAGAPFLRRWDLSANLGGTVIKDRVFLFGSLERIRETRQLNFLFPPGIPDFLQAREKTFDQHNQTFQTRSFLKLDEQFGRHRLTGQMNLTNGHVTDFLPLSQATSLPSTRTNSGSRNLLLGFHDTATLGVRGNPFLLDVHVQYRGEPLAERATHPQASPATTLFNIFSGLNTERLTGDLGQVRFGAGFTPLLLRQEYMSTGAHLDKVVGRHGVKYGWDFERTRVDGVEATNLLNQLFATVSDFGRFGPVDSGVYTLRKVGGPTEADNVIRLRNNYNAGFVQDDWKVLRTLTLNLGVRWDYDSRFPNRANLSPRLGIAWAPTPKTVIRAHWGMFYDHFRLGLARDIPGLGGANLFRNQTISFPRLFYGDPTTFPRNNGVCHSPVLSDSQIAAAGTPCPVAGLPLFGVDHLNNAVAPGHAPVPPDTVVNPGNVQALTGLTPQQFADGASAALGRQPGYFFWGGLGHLTMNFIAPRIFLIPITTDSEFKTPYTRSFHLGAEREITPDIVIQADYQHRDIRNILGVRTTNLAFEARLPGRTGELQPGAGNVPILSYGPWYAGRYDGISVGVRKRMSRRFTVEAFYTWANAVDNAFNSSFVSDVQTRLGAGSLAVNGPTDSFIGVPPVVTDPVTGQTNANGRYIARNGNPVPQAGKFYNGADLDRGPSDLALDHTLLMHGIIQLPWRCAISGIFRAQSGFHFTGSPPTPADVDGDGVLNGVDFLAGRNHFQAPGYANVDMRVSKRFVIRERVRVQAIFEFFNLLNRANPAAVQQFENVATPLGKTLQYLPGREGQVGLRFEF